ncbi:DUF3024 domain-containing protein [candidate division WOR-3 bacterium]|nr:DUF3024 domain-containing protein [candidate division WOR-3 bacterium]
MKTNKENLNKIEILKTMEDFINQIRPKKELRHKVDIAYKFDKQSIIIYEIRPFLRDMALKIESPVAKAVYVKSKNHWNIYWMKRDLRWHSYYPDPEVDTLDEFLNIVKEDEEGCFWG